MLARSSPRLEAANGRPAARLQLASSQPANSQQQQPTASSQQRAADVPPPTLLSSRQAAPRLRVPSLPSLRSPRNGSSRHRCLVVVRLSSNADYSQSRTRGHTTKIILWGSHSSIVISRRHTGEATTNTTSQTSTLVGANLCLLIPKPKSLATATFHNAPFDSSKQRRPKEVVKHS